MKRAWLKATTAWIVAASLLDPAIVVRAPWAQDVAGRTGPDHEPALTSGTAQGTMGARQWRQPGSANGMSLQQRVALLRQKVKYVFVLFQENRSFDFYFGTFPGANGLFSTYPGANPKDPVLPAGEYA